MSLLNGLLAFGALAFTVPLVIHLLHRSRFRTIDWGAMHLLESIIRINRRRMQISNLILLLLRCAIPILLAFCLARPVWNGFKTLPGDNPQSLVLVIDDSRSMDAGQPGELSRLERAKQDLIAMLKQMSRRDEVILVRGSNVEAPPGTMGISDAVARIRELRGVGGPVDLGRLAAAAAEATEQASHQQRRVLIVSDFQQHMFGSGAMETLQNVSAAMAEQTPKPVVGFWNFGIESEQLSNVSVDSIAVDSPAVVAGRSTQYSARIRNAGDTPASDLRVIWSIAGQALEPRIANIDPQSSTVARLNHRIDQPGTYEINVAVEHGDALAADNRRSIATNVMREINVLLVDGDPSNEPLEGATDFLAIALSPFAFGGDDQPDAVRTSTVRISRVPAELDKTMPEVVVLAGVAEPSEGTKKALANYVLAGGALVIFDGDKIKTDKYNSSWQCDAGTFALPATMESVIGDPASADGSVYRIGELNPQYPPWGLLAAGDQRPLAEVGVRAYRQLAVNDAAVDSEGRALIQSSAAAVLLRMADGKPLVVSATRGRGQIVQFAIPCDDSWSTLPLRLVYLPMMQQLVLDLAGKGKAERIDVSEPIAVPLREFDLADTGVSDSKQVDSTSYTAQVPGGDEVSTQPVGDVSPRLAWTETDQPGTYWFRRITTIKGDADPLVASTLRVVDVPEIESQLRDVSPDRLSAASGELNANVYTSVADIQADDRLERYGREIWPHLLAALLLFLILEMFIQQRLVRSTITVEKP